jgi:hypothetical protein
MNLIRLIHSFFKKWVISVQESNYYESLVALETPPKSNEIDTLATKQPDSCCEY